MNIELIMKRNDWKDDFTTKFQESRVEKCHDRNRKDQQIITKYTNRRHHWIKQVDQCKGEISLRWNSCALQEPKHKSKSEWELRLERQEIMTVTKDVKDNKKKNMGIC